MVFDPKQQDRQSAEAARHEQDLLKCVHCGFCLSACPTYLETGSEADSPRGRIVMMRALHDGRASADSPDLRRHLDLCLGCRACEPACPSGVPYGNLIEHARREMNKHRPVQHVGARRALLDSLADPARMRITLGASRIFGGMPKAMQRLLQGDPNQTPVPVALRKPPPSYPLPAFVPASGKRRARVGMLTGCAMRVLYGDVNEATASILAANGCEVLVNQKQGCCGALHLHNGFEDEARGLARNLIDAFGPVDGLDSIAVNSAGCGSTMKEYAHLLRDDPAYAEKAERLAAKCKDISELLDDLGWVAPLGPIRATVTYHDACHLAQAQRILDAPRRLLSLIPELTIVPLPESEVCCGSAGIYNLTEPDMALALQRRKIANIMSTGALAVVTGNPGCLSWIEAGLTGRGVEVLHPASLMRRALA
jgi:glycolate oxidase iron-sulfur subunit